MREEDIDDAVSFAFSRQLFLRLLGVVYLIAFVSLGVQIAGLVGAHGILPIGELLPQVHSEYGARAYRLFPTLLWLSTSDAFLSFLCWGGAALSIALTAGIAPVPVLVLLWGFYLSLTVAGQLFLEFQWDALLLETGLLACLYAPLRATRSLRGRAFWTAMRPGTRILFPLRPPHSGPRRAERARKILATSRGALPGYQGAEPRGWFPGDPEPSPIVRWVLWSLAYKLTFLSGITKILSGDRAWADWTAMAYHYETQPIPAWTSWYAHQLPAGPQYWSVPGMLAIEIVAPFALFLPARFRRTRLVACVSMILLQVAIGVTGNYGFFNLLAVTLYLAALDDQTLQRLSWRPRRAPAPGRPEPAAWRLATSLGAVAIACLSLVATIREMQLTAGTSTQIERTWAGGVLRWVSPFRAVNGYGLFRVMTTARPEIVIEVSADGQDWREYEFRWKAGDPTRRPGFVQPHMPRLDWQMWFAALDPGGAQYWLERLVQRILAGEPAVLRLLGPGPLTERPRFVRLAYYDYRFTTPTERAATGAWWRRTFLTHLTEPIPATP